MFKEIDLTTWKRKDIFNLFKTYDDPYFNSTFEVDVSNLFRQCRYKGYSFFLSSLYLSNKAANAIDGFKLRFKDGGVICYDTIDLGSTILLENNTFTFCYFNFETEIHSFLENGQKAIEQLKSEGTFEPKDDKDDLIHYSVLPWMRFSSFKNARRGDPHDAIPKIVFGKVTDVGNKKMMPVNVELHHAMADGYDMGLYYEGFQKLLDSIV